MKLKILYDNEAETGFESSWGFSCLVEHDSKKLLFDTGWNGNTLLHNMQHFNIESSQIDIFVLSHSHWDHIGGLNHVLHERAKVYVPSAFAKQLKEEIGKSADLVQVTIAQQILRDIYTLGELGKDFKEQSLGLVLDRGVLVLTGCAHPGLKKILRAGKELGDLYGVAGGFHGFKKLRSLKELPLIVPCHCTARKKEIIDMYPKTSRTGCAGLVLELS